MWDFTAMAAIPSETKPTLSTPVYSPLADHSSPMYSWVSLARLVPSPKTAIVASMSSFFPRSHVVTGGFEILVGEPLPAFHKPDTHTTARFKLTVVVRIGHLR